MTCIISSSLQSALDKLRWAGHGHCTAERSPCRAQVLTAFLLSAAHHEQLLPLLKRWPPQLYSVTALTEATLHRCQQRWMCPCGSLAACSMLQT